MDGGVSLTTLCQAMIPIAGDDDSFVALDNSVLGVEVIEIVEVCVGPCSCQQVVQVPKCTACVLAFVGTTSRFFSWDLPEQVRSAHRILPSILEPFPAMFKSYETVGSEQKPGPGTQTDLRSPEFFPLATPELFEAAIDVFL